MSWIEEAARIVRGHCDQLNTEVLEVGELSTRQLCTLYYVTSMVYYVYDDEILKDHIFEEICQELSNREIDEYIYLHIDKEDLAAGTGYALKYPDAIAQITQEVLYGSG